MLQSHTCSLLRSRAGSTSFTVRSTKTPPTNLKHLLPPSTPFSTSTTSLHTHTHTHPPRVETSRRCASIRTHSLVFVVLALQFRYLLHDGPLFLPQPLKRGDYLLLCHWLALLASLTLLTGRHDLAHARVENRRAFRIGVSGHWLMFMESLFMPREK